MGLTLKCECTGSQLHVQPQPRVGTHVLTKWQGRFNTSVDERGLVLSPPTATTCSLSLSLTQRSLVMDEPARGKQQVGTVLSSSCQLLLHNNWSSLSADVQLLKEDLDLQT